MLAPWAIDEMKTANLHDKRLTKRLNRVLSDLGERPTVSIPAACGGHKDTTAAYRFFDNDKTTAARILQPHADFQIEVFFRVLKSGCRIEERLFEDVERLQPCLAVYLIVAWRTLLLCRLGRSQPDLNCEAVFEPAEWQAVWMVTQQSAPPAEPPKLATMLKLIAELGGYVNRPGRKDPPGPQTIWLGLQRMRDLAWAWRTFGPGAAATARAEDV